MAYNLLKGKRGIIFGALDHLSIAWKTAERAHEEGAIFTLSNTPLAMRFGEINELAEKTGSQIVPADASSVEDLEEVFRNNPALMEYIPDEYRYERSFVKLRRGFLFSVLLFRILILIMSINTI